MYIDPMIEDDLVALRFLHGQKEGDRVGDIINAVRPIAHVTFKFRSSEELETVRGRITELIYPVMR
jgi:hypothetical protein